MVQTDKREFVRKSLTDQLVQMNADVGVFLDMIDKYMALWEVDRQLTEDIEVRGVMYTDKSSVGVPMMKNNPSVKEQVAVNRQMLAILNQLNIRTDNVVSKDDDDRL